MIGEALLKRLNQSHALEAWGYIAIVIGLSTAIITSLAGLNDDYADFSAAAARLAALDGHGRAGDRSDGGPDMQGSPFLDGPTVTIAGADLQRRVAGAVAAVGGNVLSSQIDLQGSQASEGYVILSASCEITQDALQPLLYDLEAGMPFLFVEQLVVQAPQAAGAESEGKRMRVQIDVAGQWLVAK
ncbi:MAG: type II secretion system protein GspM [Methylocella sp.]